MPLQLDPVVIALLALSAGLYQHAVIRLRRRGYAVPRLQQAFWWIGIALLAFGLLGPLAAFAGELFWTHMAEHLLIADIAAPFLVAGIRTPVFLFMPPREVLVLVGRNRPLRAVGRFVTRPLVALPLALFTLYFWHLGPLFTEATRNPAVHALQHQSFLIANIILWWPALEPSRRPMPADLWKIAYLLAGRMGAIMMGALFLVSNRAFYPDLYGATAKQHGLSAVSDQHLGAGLMMMADVAIMMTVLAVFFAQAASQNDRLEARNDERAARSADEPAAPTTT